MGNENTKDDQTARDEASLSASNGSALPWSERVVMLSIHPEAATAKDVAEMAAQCMEALADKKSLKMVCDEWAEDHTHLQNLCREVGYSEDEVEGSSYGVPGIKDLADMLREKITANVEVMREGAKTKETHEQPEK